MSVRDRFKSPSFLTTLFLLIFAALMFRVVWPLDQVVQSNDYNYGLMGQYKTELPDSFSHGFWRGSPLLGRAGHASPTWTNLSLSLLPLDLYMDWIYAINLLLASGFMIAFLRLRNISWIPAIAAALTAYWLGSNLTLVYAGHLEKYGVLVFSSAALYCIEQTLRKASWRWAILAGGALGWMLMHQADLALFFGIVLGAYYLFSCLSFYRKNLSKRLLLLLPLLLMGLLFSYQAYHFSMQHHVDNVEILQQGDPEAKWNFATQWSFPPEESIDFIAPGYWGWQSQHDKAPYHGRMGQSAEWPTQNQGFPNFKLESVYVGILPVFFAFFAIFHFKLRKKQILFWATALLITFALACGKFTPLYHLFYQLPLVNSIRNPNKFIQVSQWILGILCAFGLQSFLSTDLRKSAPKWAAATLLFISIIAALGSLFTQPSSETQLEAFAQSPWLGQAAGILQNQQLSLLHLSLMAAMGAALLYASLQLRFRQWALAGILLLISTDALLLSKEYIKPANTRFIKENELATFLKKNLGDQRVAVIDTRGLYNFYLTHLFPYHHIAFADIAVAPRLQSDYQAYFDALGQDRIRLWQEFGVKYILAPRETSTQILAQPGINRVLREVYSYDIAEHPLGGLRIAPGRMDQKGSQVVLELLLPSDRFTLIPQWASESADAYLTSLRAGEAPFQKARVQQNIEPGTDPHSGGEITGVLQNTSGFLLQVQVEADRAFLRLADHYDPHLRARIDKGPAFPLLQTDLLFAGIELPHGIHEVEFFLPPPSLAIRAQWTGICICLLVALSFLKKPKPAADPESEQSA
ncbi:hypothetical protein P3T73_14920 [Kiritimatiellota bacterium B12222]|nr:hypothetical protein P3T73_14920 [Kiritimatiellota bacterium B12222]